MNEEEKKSLIESVKSTLVDAINKSFGSTQADSKVEVVDEEMVSYEVVYEPFVKDAHNQWMSDTTIEKAATNFNKNLEAGIVQPNLFHMQDTEAFTIESTWVQKELDVQVVQTGEVIRAGTWVAKIKYNDPDLWELRKANIVGGVSIGGSGYINKETGEITNVTFDRKGDD
ncbi:hypothetical protein D3C85_859600 [compost metagenome]